MKIYIHFSVILFICKDKTKKMKIIYYGYIYSCEHIFTYIIYIIVISELKIKKLIVKCLFSDNIYVEGLRSSMERFSCVEWDNCSAL